MNLCMEFQAVLLENNSLPFYEDGIQYTEKNRFRTGKSQKVNFFKTFKFSDY